METGSSETPPLHEAPYLVTAAEKDQDLANRLKALRFAEQEVTQNPENPDNQNLRTVMREVVLDYATRHNLLPPPDQ